jgi:hypothetical protein
VPCGMAQAVWVLDDSHQDGDAQPLLLQRLAVPPDHLAAARGAYGGPVGHANNTGPTVHTDRVASGASAGEGAVIGTDSLADQELLVVHCPGEVSLLRQEGALKLEALRLQVFARLRQVMPFLDEHLVAWKMPLVPPEAADASSSGAGDPPSSRTDTAWHLQPLYTPRQTQGMGLMGRTVQTPFHNLLRCGKDVLPGLGLEGEYMTAGHVAEWLQQAVGTP